MILMTLVAALIADPLAPAREGQLQCHSPDVARKTCAALAGYTFPKEGLILNQAETLLNPSPAIIMRVESPVQVRGGAICGDMSGVEGATFTIEGQPAEESTTALLRGQVETAFAQIGREGCTTYTPQGDGLLAEVTVDGKSRPDLNQPVIWVSPADGYSIRL